MKRLIIGAVSIALHFTQGKMYVNVHTYIDILNFILTLHLKCFNYRMKSIYTALLAPEERLDEQQL